MSVVIGKTALVTGAGSGIGKATSVLFAEQGARVVATDIDYEAAKSTADAITAAGGEALAIELNVGSEAAWEAAIEHTKNQFSQLDILVNNAAVIKIQECRKMSLADWRFVQSINLDGVFLGVRAALNAMMPEGIAGSIINVSSINGLDGGGAAMTSAYCASKAGVRLLTKSVALECAQNRSGIRVNSVCPGGMDKSMSQILSDEDEARKQEARRKSIPLGRCAEAIEIARGILFLASDNASYITGSDLVIDGAFTAGFYQP